MRRDELPPEPSVRPDCVRGLRQNGTKLREETYALYLAGRPSAGTLRLPFTSVEVWCQKLASSPEDLFSLVAVANEEVVGSIALQAFPTRWRARHVGDIGMAVRDDWQGEGAGTKLMEAALDLAEGWLGLARIELRVYVGNEAAVALYRKFDFEGTLRRYAFRNGKYVDAYVMARLK